jgi:DNA-binding NarL/FixJ family response regulator
MTGTPPSSGSGLGLTSTGSSVPSVRRAESSRAVATVPRGRPGPRSCTRRAACHNRAAPRARVRMADSITCLVADDHPAMVEAVCDVLEESGIEIAGRARDGEEALEKIEQHRPTVALVDLRMPRMSGIELARSVGRSVPGTAVVLYTAFGERALLTEALDAGVRGFLLKEAPLSDLVRAVEMVAGGQTYVDPGLAGVLATSESAAKATKITQREREVLRLLADGLTNEEIGKRLFISPETVRTHVRKAMGKLDADTRTQAVATALRQSLIA